MRPLISMYLMEDSPCEAIKNNVMGTYKTAYAAMAHGCKRFCPDQYGQGGKPDQYHGSLQAPVRMIIQAFDAR